jgi:hypothetical protein
MELIVLPLIERDTATLRLGICVTLADGQFAEALEPKRRQLTDAFIREL